MSTLDASSFNWRRGLWRLWVFGASAWLLAAPFWTNIANELSYAHSYFTDRDTLRSDLIARGACHRSSVKNEFDIAAESLFGPTPKPQVSPADVANDASKACESNNKIVRFDSNLLAVPKVDCSATWLDAYQKQTEAIATDNDRQRREAEQRAKEAEQKCVANFLPDLPKFEATAFVIAIPTIGVASFALLLVFVVRVLRWVTNGFKKS